MNPTLPLTRFLICILFSSLAIAQSVSAGFYKAPPDSAPHATLIVDSNPKFSLTNSLGTIRPQSVAVWSINDQKILRRYANHFRLRSGENHIKLLIQGPCDQAMTREVEEISMFIKKRNWALGVGRFWFGFAEFELVFNAKEGEVYQIKVQEREEGYTVSIVGKNGVTVASATNPKESSGYIFMRGNEPHPYWGLFDSIYNDNTYRGPSMLLGPHKPKNEHATIKLAKGSAGLFGGQNIEPVFINGRVPVPSGEFNNLRDSGKMYHRKHYIDPGRTELTLRLRDGLYAEGLVTLQFETIANETYHIDSESEGDIFKISVSNDKGETILSAETQKVFLLPSHKTTYGWYSINAAKITSDSANSSDSASLSLDSRIVDGLEIRRINDRLKLQGDRIVSFAKSSAPSKDLRIESGNTVLLISLDHPQKGIGHAQLDFNAKSSEKYRLASEKTADSYRLKVLNNAGEELASSVINLEDDEAYQSEVASKAPSATVAFQREPISYVGKNDFPISGQKSPPKRTIRVQTRVNDFEPVIVRKRPMSYRLKPGPARIDLVIEGGMKRRYSINGLMTHPFLANRNLGGGSSQAHAVLEFEAQPDSQYRIRVVEHNDSFVVALIDNSDRTVAEAIARKLIFVPLEEHEDDD